MGNTKFFTHIQMDNSVRDYANHTFTEYPFALVLPSRSTASSKGLRDYTKINYSRMPKGIDKNTQVRIPTKSICTKKFTIVSEPNEIMENIRKCS